MHADYHTHSTYSDGGFLANMVAEAAAAGLDAVGITDHCNVSERPSMRQAKLRSGYNLDLTYERRREAIAGLREEVDIAVYDAVEMDYHPDDEDGIRSFLDEAGFDYALGSVHEVDGANVHFVEAFEDRSVEERQALVDAYFDDLEALVRSELFEIAAHADIVERNEALRGLAGEEHYRQAAAAFADSRTVPEINAGRINADYGEFHPAPTFLDVLFEYDVRVTVGTDSHWPGQLRNRVPELREFLEHRGFWAVSPFEV